MKFCPYCLRELAPGTADSHAVILCPMCGGFWVRLNGTERTLTRDEMQNLRETPVVREMILNQQREIFKRLWG